LACFPDPRHGRPVRISDGAEPVREHQVRLEEHLLHVRPRRLRRRRKYRLSQFSVDDSNRRRIFGQQTHRNHRLFSFSGTNNNLRWQRSMSCK